MRRDVFQAIADPNRRALLQLITEKEQNLNALSAYFPISRPAISKHIRILTECGLIQVRQEGRERICEAKLQSLEEVDEWLVPYRHFWIKKLDALGDYLQSQPEKLPKKHASSNKKQRK